MKNKFAGIKKWLKGVGLKLSKGLWYNKLHPTNSKVTLMLLFILSGLLIINKGYTMNFEYLNFFNKYQFEKLPNFKKTRSNPSVVEMKDGNLFFSGGMYTNRELTNSTEIYDFRNKKFVETANMNEPRVGHSSIVLPNGNILITGGDTYCKNKTGRKTQNTAEIYLTKENKFISIQSMNNKMHYHKMFILNNDNVLVIQNPSTLELFDTKKLTFEKLKGINTGYSNEYPYSNFLFMDKSHILIWPPVYLEGEKVHLVILNLENLSLTPVDIDLFNDNSKKYYGYSR